jgi:hypothetical protein
VTVRGIVYVVFVLPIVSSIIFGALVLNGILIEEPDRKLNMWQFDSTFVLTHDVEILGLEKQYSRSDPVEIQVTIDDSLFDCGDLYITIYDVSSLSRQVLTQSGFFEQCFAKNNSVLPIGDEFSEIVDKSGNYEIVVQMLDKNGKNSISSSAKFAVK